MLGARLSRCPLKLALSLADTHAMHTVRCSLSYETENRNTPGLSASLVLFDQRSLCRRPSLGAAGAGDLILYTSLQCQVGPLLGRHLAYHAKALLAAAANLLSSLVLRRRRLSEGFWRFCLERKTGTSPLPRLVAILPWSPGPRQWQLQHLWDTWTLCL